MIILSKKIAEDLIKLGCVSNKSLIFKFPLLENNLKSSFIHGYFDDDGNIYSYKNKIHFKLLGTEYFLIDVAEFFNIN